MASTQVSAKDVQSFPSRKEAEEMMEGLKMHVMEKMNKVPLSPLLVQELGNLECRQ